MKLALIALIPAALFLSVSCSSDGLSDEATGTSTAAPASPLEGTWRFAAIDGKPISQEFYIAYQNDGTVLTWPWANNQAGTAGGVSSGEYYTRDGQIFLVRDNADDTPSRYRISGNRLLVTNQQGNTLTYQRIPNPPLPGSTLQ